MTIDDFQPTSDARYYADTALVDDAERRIGVRFPEGYREFISRFGEGLLGGYLRVYPPYQMLEGDNSIDEWRKRIDEYWFWDEGKEILPKEKAIQCHIIADTVDGDELVAHPSEPNRLYVLPRYEETIYIAGDGLLPAIEWLFTSGAITDPIDDRTFEPFDGKAARSPSEIDLSVRPPTDFIALETTHHNDGRIVCRVYRFGEEHYREPWEEGSPLPVDESAIREKAAQAAAIELGEPARVEELELVTSTEPAHYLASCMPVAEKGFGFLPRTVYLDLRGTPIIPSEHVFTESSEYEAFEQELYRA